MRMYTYENIKRHFYDAHLFLLPGNIACRNAQRDAMEDDCSGSYRSRFHLMCFFVVTMVLTLPCINHRMILDYLLPCFLP